MERKTNRLFFLPLFLIALFQAACSTQNVTSKIDAVGVRGIVSALDDVEAGQEVSFEFDSTFNVTGRGVRAATETMAESSLVDVIFIGSTGLRFPVTGTLNASQVTVLVPALSADSYAVVFKHGDRFYVWTDSAGKKVKVVVR